MICRVYSLLGWVLFLCGSAGCSGPDTEWLTLFDGRSLDGWSASENVGSFVVEEGAIVTRGPRSHLFYMGNGGDASFQNFDFRAEVKTTAGSNSGIYFHTRYQEEGWPSHGYEAQVWNSHRESSGEGWVERKMTGSLYGIRNTWKAPVRDGEWFDYRILVEGKTIRIWIDDHLIVDYTEPAEPFRPDGMADRILDRGTFALQCHDPASEVRYRNLRVKLLPADTPSSGEPPQDLELNRRVISLGSQNFPLLDLHVHLKGGLDLEEALAHARRYGLTYGIAVNCGLDMTVESQEELEDFLENDSTPPQAYLAMQAEGREWLEIFDLATLERFDYVFTDAMTWTDDEGKRMRLWMEEEVEVGDPQLFMETLVDRIEGILNDEPIDIYVNPTYLPRELQDRYDELWTEERMDRVIRALVDNEIALEINDARRIPSPAFLKRAKAAGAKFTFGTNNAGVDDLGYLRYGLEMVEECGLSPGDMWMPGP